MTVETPDTPKPAKRRLTVDEINGLISDIAQDEGAGADRFRALKMLADSQSASIVLPQPRSDGEVIDRVARIMKGAGPRLTQLAYVRAFPSAAYATFGGAKLTYGDATPEMYLEAKKATSLRILNRMFPEARVNGMPKGFPSGRSIAAKIEWCQNQALKILVEREKKARKTAHEELAQQDSLIRDQATTAAEPTSRSATDGYESSSPTEGLQERDL